MSKVVGRAPGSYIVGFNKFDLGSEMGCEHYRQIRHSGAQFNRNIENHIENLVEILVLRRK